MIKNYLSLVKFSHTIFALPFACIGSILGWQYLSNKQVTDNFYLKWQNRDSFFIPSFLNEKTSLPYFFIYLFALVILCMVFARSAAMAFNRYLDANYDRANPRTAIREIPAGIISEKKVLLFTIICSVGFITSCFFINKICFYLSFVALFVILFYSYTKRFTALCHLVLGVGLSLAPIGAYLAFTGKFNILPILFSLVVLFWVSGFDIIYALQDEYFDKSQKLHSIPVLFGKENALKISRIFHLISALILIYISIYYYEKLGWLFCIATLFFVAALIYQHRLVKPNDLSKVNLAFFTTNGIASVVFGLLTISAILKNYYFN